VPPVIATPPTMSKKVFGHIPGYKSGYTFNNHRELRLSGVHIVARSGIHGSSKPSGGAYSVCLIPGKYEDDVDYGDKITYVGAGGQHKDTKVQIEGQTFDKPSNKALCISHITKKPVRVIRKANKHNKWAPSSGYEYAGLYFVESTTMRPGKAGFNMCFFELRKIENDDTQVASSSSSSTSSTPSPSPSPSSSQGN